MEPPSQKRCEIAFSFNTTNFFMKKVTLLSPQNKIKNKNYLFSLLILVIYRAVLVKFLPIFICNVPTGSYVKGQRLFCFVLIFVYSKNVNVSIIYKEYGSIFY